MSNFHPPQFPVLRGGFPGCRAVISSAIRFASAVSSRAIAHAQAAQSFQVGVLFSGMSHVIPAREWINYRLTPVAPVLGAFPRHPRFDDATVAILFATKVTAENDGAHLSVQRMTGSVDFLFLTRSILV